MRRLILFLATNLAVMVVISFVLKVLGLEAALYQRGVHIDLMSLLAAAGVVGMTGSFISLAMSKFLAKISTGAQVIAQPSNATEAWLLQTVSHHAQVAGISMPEVAVYDSPDINAFATGMDRDHALVAVSTGLLRQMEQPEAEAVLGHEITHVSNGDMVTMALIQGVLNTFVFFLSRVVGFVVDRALSRGDDRNYGYGPGYWLTVMVAQIVFGILASVIVMWFSRQREFRADAGGARLAGREKMIAALQRLQAAYEPPQLPKQLAAFGISGGRDGGLMRLFMSHPPLEERIAALRNL